MKYLCLVLLIPLCGHGQVCQPSSAFVISPHFFYTSNEIGGGFEIGRWTGSDDGRFSCFGGATFSREVMHSLKSGDSVSDIHGTFYAKGMYTVVRYPGIFHVYAVASAGIQDFEKFVPEVGMRFVLPVMDNLGLALEPLYDFKKLNWYARVIFAL